MNGAKLIKQFALAYQICIKNFQKAFPTSVFDYIKTFSMSL